VFVDRVPGVVDSLIRAAGGTSTTTSPTPTLEV
jgi:hypothetical protein